MIYVLLFFMYSFLGWCMEVCNEFYNTRKFVNRGFLIGPLCPIYGWGCLAIIISLDKYLNDPIVLFFMAIIICSVIEYFTSYFMEKLFKARWWDYSEKKYNLNGRVCLETMVPFGILGTVIMYVVNPFFESILSDFNPTVLLIISIILIILYIVDNIISLKTMINLRTLTNKINKDSTEEISKKIKSEITSKIPSKEEINNWIKKEYSKKSILSRRLIKSFPKIKLKLKDLKK